ncbi:MAG: hypothetical protein ACJA04_000727 [Cellvibrionaceae bacterium]|jgi:hypothetical protein
MSEKIEVRKALGVIDYIFSEGEKDGDAYVLNGLRAKSDFDGYTVTLMNDYVTLNIYFHNKFRFEYSSKKERDQFLEKMDLLYKAKR